MKGYPAWFNKKFISLTMVTLVATSLLLIPGVVELKLDYELPWRLQADHRLIVTAVHVLFSFLTAALLGALWSIHMRREWRKKRKVKSGILLVLLAAFLMLSSIGLLYTGNELLQKFFSLSHTAVGLVLPIAYFFHLRLKTN